jgi:hypothetical protein
MEDCYVHIKIIYAGPNKHRKHYASSVPYRVLVGWHRKVEIIDIGGLGGFAVNEHTEGSCVRRQEHETKGIKNKLPFDGNHLIFSPCRGVLRGLDWD